MHPSLLGLQLALSSLIGPLSPQIRILKPLLNPWRSHLALSTLKLVLSGSKSDVSGINQGCLVINLLLTIKGIRYTFKIAVWNHRSLAPPEPLSHHIKTTVLIESLGHREPMTIMTIERPVAFSALMMSIASFLLPKCSSDLGHPHETRALFLGSGPEGDEVL